MRAIPCPFEKGTFVAMDQTEAITHGPTVHEMQQVAKMFLAKGECEMLRFRVSEVRVDLIVSEIQGQMIDPSAWWLRGRLLDDDAEVIIYYVPEYFNRCFLAYQGDLVGEEDVA